MSATIKAHEVRKSFSVGRGSAHRVTEVLCGVSLRVASGELVGIVGPSGSGKSTLLYCLSGLESADAGSIEVMGRQVVGASRRALDSRNGRDVLRMLRGIADDPQRSVVMATHDLEAASLADRVLVLKDGRVVRELGRSTAAQILDAMEGKGDRA